MDMLEGDAVSEFHLFCFRDPVSKSHTKATIGTKTVEQADVNRVLRSTDVVKVADGQHYGIKGTLHTMK